MRFNIECSQYAVDMSVNENFLTAALTGAGDVAYSWDLVQDTIEWVGDVSGAFAVSTAVVSSGDGFFELLNSEDLKVRRNALSRHIARDEPFDCEYRVKAEKDDFQWVHERGCVERSPSGEPVRLAGIIRVVTERKQREVLLEQRANYDELTGHFNKSRLRDALDHALAYSD